MTARAVPARAAAAAAAAAAAVAAAGATAASPSPEELQRTVRGFGRHDGNLCLASGSSH